MKRIALAASLIATSIGAQAGEIKHVNNDVSSATALQPKYVVSMANQAPETMLCMAALKSDEEFAQIKAAYFGTEINIEQNIRCNDLPLNSFVRKYREHVVSQLSAARTVLR